jgi:hypothetical protein
MPRLTAPDTCTMALRRRTASHVSIAGVSVAGECSVSWNERVLAVNRQNRFLAACPENVDCCKLSPTTALIARSDDLRDRR